jgi:hypothetical protein
VPKKTTVLVRERRCVQKGLYNFIEAYIHVCPYTEYRSGKDIYSRQAQQSKNALVELSVGRWSGIWACAHLAFKII